MVLTEEEKRERHRLASKRYRERQKKKVKQGDKKAIKQKQKETNDRLYASAKSFIRNHANKKQISSLRDEMAARVKVLNEKNN